MNNCYKRKKNKGSSKRKRVLPLSSEPRFSLWKISLEHEESQIGPPIEWKDLINQINKAFEEIGAYFAKMDKSSADCEEELLFLLACYHKSSFITKDENDPALFVTDAQNLRSHVQRASNTFRRPPGIPPEFLEEINSASVFPVNNRGVATIVTQPARNPEIHFLRNRMASNESEKNREGIIQELTALKVEVDHFQSLLSSHQKSKAFQGIKDQISRHLDCSLIVSVEDERIEAVRPIVKTEAPKSPIPQENVEGHFEKFTDYIHSSEPSAESSVTKEPSKRRCVFSRNDSFVEALRAEEEEEDVGRNERLHGALSIDEECSELNDDFYLEPSEFEDYKVNRPSYYRRLSVLPEVSEESVSEEENSQVIEKKKLFSKSLDTVHFPSPLRLIRQPEGDSFLFRSTSRPLILSDAATTTSPTSSSSSDRYQGEGKEEESLQSFKNLPRFSISSCESVLFFSAFEESSSSFESTAFATPVGLSPWSSPRGSFKASCEKRRLSEPDDLFELKWFSKNLLELPKTRRRSQSLKCRPNIKFTDIGISFLRSDRNNHDDNDEDDRSKGIPSRLTLENEAKKSVPSAQESINPSENYHHDVIIPNEESNAEEGLRDTGGRFQRSVAIDLYTDSAEEEEGLIDKEEKRTKKTSDMELFTKTLSNLPRFRIEENLEEEGPPHLKSSSNSPSSSSSPPLSLTSSSSSSSISTSEEIALKSFPNLPHSFLRQLGLHQTKGSICSSAFLSTENLSDQDIENKFTSLSLAFKTDKLTLSNRLELQQRQRDTAERNIEEEIKDLKNAIGGLNRVCSDTETRDVLQRLTQQVDVLRQSSSRVSSAAEVYGAVQQEARIARAIEVMLLHVDNLKRLYEKEHSELEETRRILADHNLSHHEKVRSSSGLPSPESLDPIKYSSSLPNSPNGASSSAKTSPSGRIRSVSVISNHSSSDPSDTNPKYRRASYTASTTHKSETLSTSPSEVRPRSPTTSIMFNKAHAGRKIGVISGGFRKTSHGRTLISENSIFSPIAEEGKEYETGGVKTADNDFINNNNTFGGKIKKKISIVEDSSQIAHRNRSKMYWRSKSTIETTSSSITSSNDEDALLDEIDRLAIKRDSSPAGKNHKLQRHISNIRKKSIFRNVMDWYSDFSWPWDWDETILGLRYCLTGLLSLAAFLSLVFTFFGSSLTDSNSRSKHDL